jgi:putative phosphoesterase
VTVAVVSDTHLPRGTRRLPARCLDELARADLILHAGDFTGARVLADLEQLAPVHAVYGNMDDETLHEALPRERIVEVDGVRIGMVHIPGSRHGRAERLAAAFPSCQAVVYGHTHEPEVVRVGGTLVLNPGSPTERRRAPMRAMALLTVVDGVVDAQLLPLT